MHLARVCGGRYYNSPRPGVSAAAAAAARGTRAAQMAALQPFFASGGTTQLGGDSSSGSPPSPPTTPSPRLSISSTASAGGAEGQLLDGEGIPVLPSSGASGGSDVQNEDEDDLITRALGSGVKVRPPPHALVCGCRRRT